MLLVLLRLLLLLLLLGGRWWTALAEALAGAHWGLCGWGAGGGADSVLTGVGAVESLWDFRLSLCSCSWRSTRCHNLYINISIVSLMWTKGVYSRDDART